MNPDRIHKNSTRIKSFNYAIKGVFYFLRDPNALIMLFISIVVIVTGCIVKLTHIEWCIILLCIGMVFTAEAFNTSIEHLTDLVNPDFNPKAGLIKDLAAGAVLIA